MALEAEVLGVKQSNILKVSIHDTTSAFNASDCVSCSICKTCDSTGGIFERAFSNVNRIKLGVEHKIQVPDMDHPFGVGSHQQRKRATHQMNWLTDPRLTNLLYLVTLDLPKLDITVPSSGNQKSLTICLKGIDVLYCLIVFANSLDVLLLNIPSLNGSVGACQEHDILLLVT